jgi:hypothetical protein
LLEITSAAFRVDPGVVLWSRSRLSFETLFLMTSGGVFETRLGGGGGREGDEEEVVMVEVEVELELEVEASKTVLFVVAGWRLRPSTSQILGRPER